MDSTPRGIGYNAINWIYHSYNRAKPNIGDGPDRVVRHPEWTRKLLDSLGAPDKAMYNVAVTGSKGKGSHAILIAAMLQQFGFKVGLFTGPHLVDFMERFRINGEMMQESEFVAYVNGLKAAVGSWALPEDQYFGPVGLLAVIAVQWFAAQKTDVNIFELGRGALHDDVNQVTHTGAVMTPVFLEHRRELGSTLVEVGREKAGIVTKDTRWVYTHPQSADVRAAVKEASDGQEIHTLGQDFVIEAFDEITSRVSVQMPQGRFEVSLPVGSGIASAGYLAPNAAVALCAAVQIANDLRPGMALSTTIDLRQLCLPGRLQTVSENPEVVVDGTIHGNSAELVRAYLRARRDRGHIGKVGACIGIPADKDGAGVIQTLAEELDWVVVCKAHNPHLRFDESLVEYARGIMCDVEAEPFLEEALAASMRRLSPGEDLLLILGTQSLVGDAMRAFGVDTQSIWRVPMENCKERAR